VEVGDQLAVPARGKGITVAGALEAPFSVHLSKIYGRVLVMAVAVTVTVAPGAKVPPPVVVPAPAGLTAVVIL